MASSRWIGAIALIGAIDPASLDLARGETSRPAQQGGAHDENAKTEKRLEELWRAVKADEEELNHLIQTQELDRVHRVAFHLRNLVNEIAQNSPRLQAGDVAKVSEYRKQVATLAGRLDRSADAKDQTASETIFKELQSVLSAIRALYHDVQFK